MHLLKLLESQLQKGAVGTLTLGKKKGFREVFLDQDSAYLVGQHFSGKVATAKLVERGIPGARLSLEKLESAIHAADLTMTLLPQVLREAGILSEGECHQLVEAQLAQETVDLLFRNTGSFHFQEDRVPEYLLKCEDITTRVPIPIAYVLAELQRWTSLMSSCELIVPSGEEIFVATEKGLALLQQGKPEFPFQTILALVDGFRNLQSIIKDSYLFEIEVIQHIVKGLEGGYIKKTILPELKGLFTHNIPPEEIFKHLPHFKNAVKYAADEVAARERLAVAYEKIGKAEDAVIQYNFIGDALCRMKKPSKAVKAYQRALALKPDEILITDKITKIYRKAAGDELSQGNTAQAMQFLESALRVRPSDQETVGQLLSLLLKEKKIQELSNLCDWLAAYARKVKSLDVALNTCRQIVDELPGEPAFRKKLINLYLDFNLTDEAVAEMEGLARLYLEAGDTAKAQEMVEKIRRVKGSKKDIKLLQQQVESVRTLERKARARRKRVSRVCVLAAAAALLVGYQALGIVAWFDIRTASAHAHRLGAGSDAVRPLLPGPEEVRLLELENRCNSFLKQFPVHLLRGRVSRLLEEASQRTSSLAKARQERKQQTLEDAHRAADEGNKALTRVLLSSLLSLSAGDAYRKQAEDLLREVEKVGESAQALAQKARDHESAGEWKEAYRAYRQIIESFPHSEILRGLKVPVSVESLPAGAKVSECGVLKESKPLGQTPLVIHLEPGASMEVELAHPGYSPLKAEVSEAAGGTHVFSLSRAPDWTYNLEGKVEIPPVVSGSVIVCGTSQGTLLCLDAGSKASLWSLQGNAAQSLVGPPLPAKEGLFTLWTSGRVLKLSPWLPGTLDPSRASGLPVVSADFFLGSFATSDLLLLGKDSAIVVGTKAGQLLAYDSKTCTKAWSLPVEGIAGPLREIDDGDLLAGTQDGSVLRIKTGGARIAWSRRIGKETLLEICRMGTAVAAQTGKSEMALLRAEDGALLATRNFPKDTAIALSEADGKVFVLAPDGNLQKVSPETGEVLASRKVPLAAGTLAVYPALLGIRHDGGKALLLLTADKLEPAFATRLGTPITSVAVTKGCVAIATESGRLSVYSLGQ